ncbi:putative late blight resistance protein homolog R1B-16 [Salvia hispanica]|uniref:putative late blight resistance protein homolog R1B-16 n=1 Tax=Salvia hispanica TaxID=49212 RepID=UPI002009A0EC|nr:putative late blight resistance protein homolog R1B-16 [Salvia hispanica]
MAAYAALVSLMHLIDDIENHPSPPISLNKHQTRSLTQNVHFLQEFLQAYKSPVSDSDEADPLEMRIADAAYAAEDVIESHIVRKIQLDRSSKAAKTGSFFNCFRGPMDPGNVSSNHGDGDDEAEKLYQGVQNVIDEMDRIKRVAMEANTEKAVILGDQGRRFVSSFSSTGKKSSGVMVFSDDVLNGIMEKLVAEAPGRQVIPITGMGGIGKTALAKDVYSKQVIKERFDICAWATVSEQFNRREILCELVSQATNINKKALGEKSEEKIGFKLYQFLSGRRFLIVMDDVWNIESWDGIQHFFPNNENCSRIVVTTRLSQLSPRLNNHYSHKVEFLDEGSSWVLFSKTVFGDEHFPLELEKIGKEIVKNCRGLPLSIVVVGGILKNVEHTQERWKSIRNNLTSVVNLDDNKHCLRLLKKSYNHLPVYLKPCFIYMGMFEEDDAIKVSTLIKLWISEGFLKPVEGKTLETIGKGFIKDLVDRNLILVDWLGSTGNIKRVKLHDLLRDVSVNEGKKEGFYHVIGESSPRGINSQRRVVIRRNTSKEKVLDELQSMSDVRSIIWEHGKVPRCLNIRLLRTIHAHNEEKNWPNSLASRDVNFWHLFGHIVGEPICFTAHQLILTMGTCESKNCVNSLVSRHPNLRHLGVEVGKWSSVFSSFNHLWNLQRLIVYSLRRCNVPSEMWKMPQLRHIEMAGRKFIPPDPSSDIVVMENLVVLEGARNFKWEGEMVKRIPNIKKLRIQYSSRKGKGYDDYYRLSNIDRLCKLESLDILCWFDFRGNASLYKLTFPQTLKSLNLQMEHHFEWEPMLEKIGSLPLLEKLKLWFGCFGTGKWEIFEDQFPCLKYLGLFGCHRLKHLTTEANSIFPCLEKLHLYDLNGLQSIPSEIGYIPTLQCIEMNLPNESMVKCAKEIVEEQMDLQGDNLPFRIKVWHRRKNQSIRSFAGPNFEVYIFNYKYWL